MVTAAFSDPEGLSRAFRSDRGDGGSTRAPLRDLLGIPAPGASALSIRCKSTRQKPELMMDSVVRLARITLLACSLALSVFAIARADVITGGDDVITGGNVRVDFNGSMSPRTLPRTHHSQFQSASEGRSSRSEKIALRHCGNSSSQSTVTLASRRAAIPPALEGSFGRRQRGRRLPSVARRWSATVTSQPTSISLTRHRSPHRVGLFSSMAWFMAVPFCSAMSTGPGRCRRPRCCRSSSAVPGSRTLASRLPRRCPKSATNGAMSPASTSPWAATTDFKVTRSACSGPTVPPRRASPESPSSWRAELST